MNSKPLDIDTVIEIERMIHQTMRNERDAVHEHMKGERWSESNKSAAVILALEQLIRSIHSRATTQLTGK